MEIYFFTMVFALDKVTLLIYKPPPSTLNIITFWLSGEDFLPRAMSARKVVAAVLILAVIEAVMISRMFQKP